MQRAWSRAATLCAALIVAFASPASAQEGTWALTNARIETVTHGVIERGTIVIRDGLIVAVAADAAVPADARVVDLTGRTVFPGIIDLTSSLGVADAAPPAGGRGAAAAAAPAGGPSAQSTERRFVGLEPERLVADELKPTEADISAARGVGITAVLTAPSRGAFRGRSALVPLRDSVGAREVIRSPVALHMGYQGTGGGFGGGGRAQYPGTLLGVIAYERQHFYDARRQAMLEDRYKISPRGTPRPPNDEALDALIPVVKGEMPVFFAAGNENEIRRALGIAHEFGIQMDIVGATEGFRALDALQAAKRPVIVSVDYPRAPDVTGWAYRSAQRLPPNDSARADSIGAAQLQGNAAALMRAGVKFALASGGRTADFLPNVRKAIAAGLPRDSALADLTIRPAEIAGVAEQLGSIETGKAADLVITDGDLLGDSAKVKMVFVDGIRYAVEPPPPPQAAGGGRGRFGRGGPGRGGAAPEMAQVAGTWDLTVQGSEGPTEATATLTQNGATFSGNMNSHLGSSDFTGGTIDGRHVTWSHSLVINGQSMTASWSGDIDGTHISGTVAAGEMGSFPFTGEKKP
ncbi:MAG TPA: amidohydrolase family protein [Gemmatimonadales bacterium]